MWPAIRPQGSILGPLLSVLFINDMINCVSNKTNIALYADDTKIWREITCWNDQEILQNDINSLFQWAIQNKMKFHPHKCKVLRVGRHGLRLDEPIFPFTTFFYTLGDTVLEYDDLKFKIGCVLQALTNYKGVCSILKYFKRNRDTSPKSGQVTKPFIYQLL